MHPSFLMSVNCFKCSALTKFVHNGSLVWLNEVPQLKVVYSKIKNVYDIKGLSGGTF